MDTNATTSAFTFDQIGTVGWSAPEAIVQFEEAAVPSAGAAVPPEREIRIYFLYLTADKFRYVKELLF